MALLVPDEATGSMASSAHSGNCAVSNRRTSPTSVGTSSACILRAATGSSYLKSDRATPRDEQSPPTTASGNRRTIGGRRITSAQVGHQHDLVAIVAWTHAYRAGVATHLPIAKVGVEPVEALAIAHRELKVLATERLSLTVQPGHDGSTGASILVVGMDHDAHDGAPVVEQGVVPTDQHPHSDDQVVLDGPHHAQGPSAGTHLGQLAVEGGGDEVDGCGG